MRMCNLGEIKNNKFATIGSVFQMAHTFKVIILEGYSNDTVLKFHDIVLKFDNQKPVQK